MPSARSRCASDEGDLIVFPQGDPHILSSTPGMRAEPDLSIFERDAAPLPLVFERGGGGPERAHLVCGFLGCDERPYNPLLMALPRPFTSRRQVLAPRRDGWGRWRRSRLRSRAARARAARTSWPGFPS